ncbi:MAG TPA: alpha/beta hydrolase [Candidatus Krumholzibacteria bacterium]|nr:alpha/beta hydrolase [Candidatus Krumholzibacteria bacterium]HPD70668.1 alpha/beta hydrolase [Candidatus Krumholzibacteria bacterium]HRY39632.1 alpha/beta hydrolase [Candidatus Krumholzibacteria bacterium]
MTAGLVALFAIGFGYLALVLAFAVRQDTLFFKPKRGLAATPAAAGLAFTDLALVAADGVALHAWWVPGPPEPAATLPGRPFTLLYLHGANTNLGDRVDALRFWHDLGFDVLALDYRGFGRSAGRPSEKGLYLDARAAWDWLAAARGVPAGRIVIAAESLGVSLATHLALAARPAALVLEAGFTCAADVAARRYPWLPVRQVIRLDLANADRLARIRCPKLIVHSVDDATVPVGHARRLVERAAPPRLLLRIRGAHARGCVEGGPRYVDALRRWLEGLTVSTRGA